MLAAATGVSRQPSTIRERSSGSAELIAALLPQAPLF
jgi:hypothetical protein